MKVNYVISATTAHELSKHIGTGEVILADSTEGSSKGKSTTSGIDMLAVIQLSNKHGRAECNRWGAY